MAATGEWRCEKRTYLKDEFSTAKDENVPETGCLSIVILGASGDLAKKKTFLALFKLHRQGFLQSDEVRVFGYARSKISDKELRNRIRGYPGERRDRKFYAVGFQALDMSISENEISKNSMNGSRRLFYLALPPSVYPQVCRMIKNYCMNKSGHGRWTRIVVEKPFGKDLASSEELSSQIGGLFEEPQIYRIGSLFGKGVNAELGTSLHLTWMIPSQFPLVVRFVNRFFLPLWNRDSIANVQIAFREDFGTEGRGGYFDQYEIIRDIIQNHLLQVLCFVAMEKPISLKPDHIRDEKVKVLQSVIPIKDEDVVIGQYEAYRDDPTVLDNSNTPTFATIMLHIHNEQWEGVPFILEAGKALNSRKVEIQIQFKDVPGDIFKCRKQGMNEIVIRLQPSEAIYMKLTCELDLSYRQRYQGVLIPEAYEHLILNTIKGDQQHFVRRDELKVAWEIFTPFLHRIDRGELNCLPYKPGNRGPPKADELLEKAGHVQTHDHVWSPPSLL